MPSVLHRFNLHALTKREVLPTSIVNNMLKERATVSDRERAESTSSGGSSRIHHQHPCISLPLAFKIYCDKSRITYATFYIGREKGNRLKAISAHYHWIKGTETCLHEGPSTDSPVIGSSRNSLCALSSGVTLSINGNVERFDWRRSHGQDVKSLGGRGSGWKLIRTHYPGQEEVVAVYSVDLCSPKLSGRFAFLGSGATKELGREWAIATIVTALTLGQEKREELWAAAAS